MSFLNRFSNVEPLTAADVLVDTVNLVYHPNLSCAVHVMRPAEGARIFSLGHFHGEEEVTEHDHGSEHTHGHHGDHSHET